MINNASPDPSLQLLLAKAVGAIVGSSISVAYVLPKGRREAAIRFAAGVAGGFVFGTTVGLHTARKLGVDDVLSTSETALMGAALASLFLWWAIGVAMRWSTDAVSRNRGKLQSDQISNPASSSAKRDAQHDR